MRKKIGEAGDGVGDERGQNILEPVEPIHYGRCVGAVRLESRVKQVLNLPRVG